MKIFIASDIHGSYKYAKLLCDRIKAETPDKTVLLGDILYHGPRNDLPEEYDPKRVIELLTGLDVVAVRGNCDTEVDDMVLPFSVLSEQAFLVFGKRTIYFCHGHKEFLKPRQGDTVVSGHTHIPKRELRDGVLYLNPGSVSIPKEGSHHGYLIFEDGEFRFYDLLSGEEVMV